MEENVTNFADPQSSLKQHSKISSQDTITPEPRPISQIEIIRPRPISVKRNSYSGIATSPPLLYNSRHRYSIASQDSATSGNSSEYGESNLYTSLSVPVIASIPENHKMDKRRRIMSEIVQTEIRYVTDLEFIRVSNA